MLPIYVFAQSTRNVENNKRSDTIDVNIYKLHIDVTDFNTNIIKASCQVNFTAKMNNIDGISLDLLSLQVDSVIFQGFNASYTYNDTLLRISFPQNLNQDDYDSVTVYYQGNPITDASGWGGFYFQNGFAYNLGVGFAADPHNFGRVWHPCFDNFVERAQYEMKIRTLGSKRAYASGIIIDEDNSISGESTRTWKISDPIPTYLACFTVGDYVHVSQEYISPIYGYSKPVMLVARAQDTTGMKVSFTNLFSAMEIYESLYGPYLWEKIGFALVPFNAGAMEHATLVAYPQSVGAGNTTFDWLMAHELSHHWWGNLVTCKTSEDMWINEGFAVYSESIYMEQVNGYSSYLNDLKAKHLQVLQRAHFNDGDFYPLSGVPHGAVYGEHSYEKGSVMLHNMRTYLGDSLFFVGLKALQQDFVHMAVDAAEVRDKLTQATAIDMTDFFEDWIYQPGFVGVVLDSFSTQVAGQNFEITVAIRQKIRRADNLFSSFPIQVSFVNEIGDVYNETISFSGASMQASFILPFAPKLVYLNGDEGIMNAVTAKEYLVTSNGTSLDAYSYSRVISPSINPSGTRIIRFEHCRVAPDAFIDNDLGIQISSERYWRVDGIWEDGFTFNTWFVFDGRNTAGGNLDTDLMTNPNGLIFIEDSMKLLYRLDAASPWTVVESAELNKQGSSTDCSGRFELDNVQKGEYTFGIKYSALGVESNDGSSFLLYPNPTERYLSFKSPYEIEDLYTLKFYDNQGKLVFEKNVRHNESIDLNTLRIGVYVVELFQANLNIGSMKILLNK